MRTCIKPIILIGALILTVAAEGAAPGNNIVRELTQYQSPENVVKRPPHFTYMPGGKEYVLLSKGGRTIDTYDIRSGEKTGTLFDLDHVRETQLADIDGFVISPDASKVLVYRNRKSIYRRSYTAECYVYEVRSRLLKPLSDTHHAVQIPVFSPDSRMVAFVADNNIYIKKLDYNSEVAVTDDGKYGEIINGATDWTYEEEFRLTSSLTWSPDNLILCYIKFNESAVPVYTLPLYEGTCERMPEYSDYPGIMSYKYPVAGAKNSTVTLHSYNVETRKTKDIVLPDNTIEYLPRIDYGPTPEQLLVSTLNRDQNRYELYNVNPKTGIAKSIFVEKSPAWIIPEMYEDMTFCNDGFVVLSNRTGYTHLYKYSYTGALLKTLTQGEFDVTAYYGSDTQGNHYCQTATPSPIDRTVQRIDAKKGVMQPINERSGTTAASFSPNCDYAVYSFSDSRTPPVYTLATANGKELRVLEDNSAYAAKYVPLNIAKEFVKVPSDGRELNGWIMRPRNFDPSRKYPVVMTQYSGPGSQTVLNAWEMGWAQYFVEKGFIVACVDARGTANRGADFLYSVYKDLGHYETVDQINAAKYLATLPGFDGTRMGMFGWSYGGYETLMCVTRADNPFAAAVAVAPVTDWKYYDTVYAERYMLTPQQNEAGYKSSSPLKAARMLGSNLLMIYGTADDNVHPANSLQMASQLQTDGILFDMMVFPNKNHSIYGCNARSVVYGKMFDYFSKNLGLNK